IAAESILINYQDYNHRLDLNQLISSCQKNGSQATTLYQLIKTINKMVRLQEMLKFSNELSYLSVIVLTAGDIQDDIVKFLGSTYLSSFDSNSRSNSHKSGSIRIENLFVPNVNYYPFEDCFMPILNQRREAKSKKTIRLLLKQLKDLELKS
ncbi:uncharacterized protein MELLADRAFT_38133, partial [Melampsora larici-populina 98AG31]